MFKKSAYYMNTGLYNLPVMDILDSFPLIPLPEGIMSQEYLNNNYNKKYISSAATALKCVFMNETIRC